MHAGNVEVLSHSEKKIKVNVSIGILNKDDAVSDECIFFAMVSPVGGGTERDIMNEKNWRGAIAHMYGVNVAQIVANGDLPTQESYDKATVLFLVCGLLLLQALLIPIPQQRVCGRTSATSHAAAWNATLTRSFPSALPLLSLFFPLRPSSFPCARRLPLADLLRTRLVADEGGRRAGGGVDAASSQRGGGRDTQAPHPVLAAPPSSLPSPPTLAVTYSAVALLCSALTR
eukprot:1207791-Rhodomonas_salina.2